MSKDESVKKSTGRALYGSREGAEEHSVSAPTNTTMESGNPRPIKKK